MKKKLAIVSSYNESCGNASYTEVLRREFANYYDVEVIPLQLDILSSNKKNIVKLGDAHIDDICRQLKEYDFVNIQFEAGLYGSNRKAILKRTKKLINASNNLIFTMHRVDIGDSLFDIESIKKIFSSKHIFRNMKALRRDMYLPKIYEVLAKEVEKMNKKSGKQGYILVHTKRDRKNIERVYGCTHVFDFPLTFLNAEERKRIRNAEERKEFIKKYGLKEDDVVIGLFGFVTEYKGHETAIKALKFLPQNYKIMIFGSQHPMSIMHYTKIDPYLQNLITLIEDNSTKESNLNFDKRVFFVGNLNDDDFIGALYTCDFAVLPYLEVNQSGSGIASLVLESKIKALFSNNKAFAELNKYYPDTYERFDIGNYSELAYKILNYKKDYTGNIERSLEEYNIENNIRLQMDYFEGNRH